MTYVADITVDGKSVGDIDIALLEDGEPDGMTPLPDAAYPMGSGLGGDYVGGMGLGRGFGSRPGYRHQSVRYGGGYRAGPGGGPGTDPRGMEAYIRQSAIERGIDPDVAITVARSEGLGNFYGDYVGGKPTSFGAFQLHTPGGVGDAFRRDTGLDPSDPANEKATIDYALKYASEHGWGAWMGARARGITGKAGMGLDKEKLREAEKARGTRGQAEGRGTADAPGQADVLYDPITGASMGGGLGVARPGGRRHGGQDIMAPVGSPIYAVRSGVIESHNPHGTYQGDAATRIKWDDGTSSYYMHHQLAGGLAPGSRVTGGQVIGRSGYPDAPHLHFEMFDRNGNRLDPAQYFGWDRSHLPHGGQLARTSHVPSVHDYEHPGMTVHSVADIRRDVELEKNLDALRHAPAKGPVKVEENADPRTTGGFPVPRGPESWPKNIDEFVKKFGRAPTIPDEKAFYAGQSLSRSVMDLAAEAMDEARTPAQKAALREDIIAAKRLASVYNFPPERVTASPEFKGFDVGGVSHGTAGEFDPETGYITFYHGALGLFAAPHEIEHAKFHYWMKSQSPLPWSEAEMRSMERSAPKVSRYAEENWQEYRDIKRTSGAVETAEAREIAINETLAEVALAKSHYRPGARLAKFAPEWEKLFETVEKAWKSRSDD